MNIHIVRHRVTLASPDASAERKAAALDDLRSIAALNDDPRSRDAVIVLREFGQQASMENRRAGDCTETVQATESAFHGFEQIEFDPTPKPGLIEARRAELLQERRATAIRYNLVSIYRESPEVFEAVQGEVLPYKWMTRDLFVELMQATALDPKKPYSSQFPEEKREAVVATLPKWRAVKKAWEAINGPAKENLCDLLFDPETDWASPVGS